MYHYFYDHMHTREVGAHDIMLTDKLQMSCLASSSKRMQIHAENKKEKVLSEKGKTKERLTEEIGKVLQQVEAVKATTSELDWEVDECYNKAEGAVAGVETIIAKGNALMMAATEKRKLVDELQIADQRSEDIFLCCLSRCDCQKLCCHFFPVWTFSQLSLFLNIVSLIPNVHAFSLRT